MISSAANPKVRFLRSLHERQGRREAGCFLLEGVRLVADALQAGAVFELILYDPEGLEASSVGAELLEKLPADASYAAVGRAIAAAADTSTPQGIVAAVQRPSLQPIGAGPLLIVDGLQDPGNLGTMIRSAAAAAAGGVLTTPGTADVYGPKAVRAGMGAHFRVPLWPEQDWASMRALTAERSLLLAMPRGGTPYYAVDWKRPSGVIVGSEAAGPSREARALASATVTIPMRRDVESLNAAVAAGIILFEAFRQRAVRAERPDGPGAMAG